MAKNNPVRVSRSNRDSFLLPLFIITICAATTAAILAFVWQQYQNVHDPDYLYPPLYTAQSSKPDDSAPPEESSVPSSSEPSAPPEPVNLFGKPLPESTRVRTEYFNDAVFIGDSITTGLQLYDLLPDSNIVAYTGINLDVILTKKVMNDNTQTILEATTAIQPKKIYIMLGANGLAYLSGEQTADYYAKFVDEVRRENPNAIIYIQSILPIQEELFSQKYEGDLNNQKIDACNALLMKMAGEKEMYYLDVASAFKDETGGMDIEMTSDGLHFKSDSYTKWLDYLKMHAIEED